MTSPESSEVLPAKPSVEIAPEALEVLLQPDEVLAAQALDRSIQEAEADGESDPDKLALLHFQRSLINMDRQESWSAAHKLVHETGKYATFGNNGDGTLPNLHYPVARGLFVADLANTERWRHLGINPDEYFGTDAYGHAHRTSAEEAWREARATKQALVAAQEAEAAAMERASHLPEFIPKA